MLDSSRELMCGIFDSSVNMKNKTRSDLRSVRYYELELFTEGTGVSYVDGRAYPIKRGLLLCSRPGQERYSQLPIRCHYIRLVTPDGAEADALAESIENAAEVEAAALDEL